MTTAQRKEIGTYAIALSFLIWFALPLIPMLGLPGPQSLALATVGFLLTELAFWGGVALAGRSVLKQWKRRALSVFRPSGLDCPNLSTGRLC